MDGRGVHGHSGGWTGGRVAVMLVLGLALVLVLVRWSSIELGGRSARSIQHKHSTPAAPRTALEGFPPSPQSPHMAQGIYAHALDGGGGEGEGWAPTTARDICPRVELNHAPATAPPDTT